MTKPTRVRLLSVLAVFLLQYASVVESQRTIVNLGTKLKRQQQKSEEVLVDSQAGTSFSALLQAYGVEGADHFGIYLGTAVLAVIVAVAVTQILKRCRKIQDIGSQSTIQEDQVELSFEGIRLELRGKKPRTILDGSVSGKASPGRLLAIMGPSGAGKSTLMDALAGRIKYCSKLVLSGRRFINDKLVSGDSQIPAAFVPQQSNFFAHMTTREVLEFRIDLGLGKMAPSKKDAIIQSLLEQMNLVQGADTIVGDAKVRGLSGGERKRLSIACELINSPQLIFLDEPTTGLDSFQAMQVVQTLRKLADAGKTVIAVIHQPSQLAFQQFDDLLLVSEGKLMYFGPLNNVRSYFSSLGYAAPGEMGTAEHIIDCVSKVTSGGAETEAESMKRIDSFASKASGSAASSLSSSVVQRFTKSKSGPKAGLLRQFRLLLKRSLSDAFRAKGAIIIKVMQQITLGIIYGGIYHLSDTQSSIQDRFGLLWLIGCTICNMGIAGTIRSFPKEKAIVSNEIATNMYKTLPYLLAKAIADIPLTGAFSAVFCVIIYKLTGLQPVRSKFETFLGLIATHAIASEGVGLFIGAISSGEEVALALFPAVIILNIIFDGKNLSPENTPFLLKWLPSVSLIRWAFQGLVVNEFQGLEFSTGGPRRGPVVKTGEDALARFGYDDSSVLTVFRTQGIIIAACWFLSYVGLTVGRQKYMVMKEPGSGQCE